MSAVMFESFLRCILGITVGQNPKIIKALQLPLGVTFPFCNSCVTRLFNGYGM